MMDVYLGLIDVDRLAEPPPAPPLYYQSHCAVPAHELPQPYCPLNREPAGDEETPPAAAEENWEALYNGIQCFNWTLRELLEDWPHSEEGRQLVTDPKTNARVFMSTLSEIMEWNALSRPETLKSSLLEQLDRWKCRWTTLNCSLDTAPDRWQLQNQRQEEAFANLASIFLCESIAREQHKLYSQHLRSHPLIPPLPPPPSLLISKSVEYTPFKWVPWFDNL